MRCTSAAMAGNGIVLDCPLFRLGKLCQPMGRNKEMARTSNRSHNTHKADKPTSGSSETVVELRKPKGERKGNIFATEKHSVQDDAAHALQIEQQARQILAEAQDKFRQAGTDKGGEDKLGTGLVREAKELAAKAALLLTTARIADEMSQDQINGVLLDIFGAKPKKDGTPGTTPMGQGEALRKRIQRLVAARDYVSGATKDGFFANCPEQNVREVLDQTMNGTRPFWQAYEDLAKIKNETRTPPPPLAFNVKKILEMSKDLGTEGAVKMFLENEALVQAYSKLLDLAQTVGEQVYEIQNKAA